MINLTGNGKIKILKSNEVSKLHGKCSYHVLLSDTCVALKIFKKNPLLPQSCYAGEMSVFLTEDLLSGCFLLTGSSGRALSSPAILTCILSLFKA